MAASVPFETEVKFELPKGYVDKEGKVHKKGVMRLANAADEIEIAKRTAKSLTSLFLFINTLP